MFWIIRRHNYLLFYDHLDHVRRMIDNSKTPQIYAHFPTIVNDINFIINRENQLWRFVHVAGKRELLPKLPCFKS